MSAPPLESITQLSSICSTGGVKCSCGQKDCICMSHANRSDPFLPDKEPSVSSPNFDRTNVVRWRLPVHILKTPALLMRLNSKTEPPFLMQKQVTPSFLTRNPPYPLQTLIGLMSLDGTTRPHSENASSLDETKFKDRLSSESSSPAQTPDNEEVISTP
jgi:hypothetical protein